MTAVLTACSCGSAGTGTDTAASDNGTQTAETVADNGASASDEGTPAETQSTEPAQEAGSANDDSADGTDTNAEQGGDGYVLYNQSSGDVSFIVDRAGNKLAEYDVDSSQKLLTESTSGYTLKAIGDGLLYYGDYIDAGDISVFRLYAVDPASKETAIVWTAEKGQLQESVDIYEGKIHITYSTDDDKRGEYVFVRTPGKLVFEEEPSPIPEFFDAAGPYTLYGTAREPADRYEKCCYERMLDDYGHVVGRDYDSNEWVLISRDGSVTKIASMKGRNAYVEGYDAKYMFIESYGDDYSADGLCVINLETFGERKTDLKYDEASIIAFRDGCVYYALDESDEYYRTDNHIFRYNIEDDFKTELYSVRAVPGASFIGPGTQGIRLIGDHIYYVGVSEDELHWYSVDIDGGTPADTGLKIRDVSALKFGKVDCRSETDVCRFCGTVLGKTYAETLELDPSWSEHADKINEYLKNMLYKGFAGSDEEYPQTDEDCAEHREYPEQWCTTVDDSISDVYVISDRYLAVNISGYWYGGGAHGYPERGQYIFDLKTGENLKLADLYSGSAEDFKKFIAEKTKADYIKQKKESEYPQYFAESEEEAYNSAYETADLNTTYIEFMEDDALIVFQPYEMGSYAAGYIEIPVSYRELFGRDKL